MRPLIRSRLRLRRLQKALFTYINNPTTMKMKSSAQVGDLLSLASASLAAYDLVKTYSGNSVFDSWSYCGYCDNLTSGVQLSCPAITIRAAPPTYSPVLTFPFIRGCHLRQPDNCRPATAYIRELCRQCVDNTTFVPYNEKRNTVMITPNI